MDTREVDSLKPQVLEQIVACSTQGILLVDVRAPDYRIVFANKAYERLSGFAADELIGNPWSAVFASDLDGPERIELERRIACGDAGSMTLPFFRRDGAIWLAHTQVDVMETGPKRLALIQNSSVSNASREPKVSTKLLQRALGRAQQRIAALKQQPISAGLLSIDQFMTFLRRDLGIARREHRSITLVLFEIPEHDVYRETFGSKSAESCLRMVGRQLLGSFGRASDLCAQIDDSTFVVALQEQDPASAELLAARVGDKTRRLSLHNPRAKASRYITVRHSLVVADPSDDSAERLLDRARAGFSASSELAASGAQAAGASTSVSSSMTSGSSSTGKTLSKTPNIG
jgi:PAS domain S-box-containing protein